MVTRIFKLAENVHGGTNKYDAPSRAAGAHCGSRLGRFGTWAVLGLLLCCIVASSGCGGAGKSQETALVPQFSLGQGSVSFPDTTVGTTSSTTANVILESVGNASLNISNITDSDLTDFPATTNCPFPGTMAPGSGCTITIQFKPSESGALSAQIVVSTNAGNGTITLSGNGVAASQCAITPEGGSDSGITPDLPFFIVFWNTGEVPVSIESITLSGDFTLVNGTGGPWPTCPSAPFNLAVGQACNVYVEFTPVGSGNFTGALNAATSCPAESLITYSFSGSN
jgi:hypothetical protein